MKRFSFFIILFVTLFASNVTIAETHPLAAEFSNIQDVLYLEDGSILYSKYDGENDIPHVNQLLNKIICIDAAGKRIWKCEIPAFSYSPFSSLIETTSKCFAYLGKKNDGTFSVLTISKSGELIKEYTLPEKISTPILLSDGVLYISEKNTIEKMLWNETITSVESDNAFDRLVKAETVNARTYISAVSDNEQLLLCIDASGKEMWKYSLGEKENFVQAWCTQNDSLVVACQSGKDITSNSNASIRLIEINKGEKKWETEISYRLSIVRAQLLLHNTDESYSLFGRLDDNHGVYISISPKGRIIECTTVNASFVDFVQYKDAIYAIEYATKGDVFPVSFVNYSLFAEDAFNGLDFCSVN